LQHGILKSPLHRDCEHCVHCQIASVDLLTRKHVFSYIASVLLKRIFMFKCTLPMLRLTTVLALMSLPLAITHLVCFHKRIRPPSSSFVPTADALVLGAFPIAWFFGFLYYTEVPSLVFVVWTVVLASQDRHWLAAVVRLCLLFNRAADRWVCGVWVTVRPHKLYLSPNKCGLGSLCICGEPAHVPAI
jgi:hypothetical protein